ncbi:solute carrier family 12 member 8 isoform X2 [Cataglyphis hispanica]|uniref:solute carrier family 12 member 8 isoform X2 n=1 Tax=Cataglyphis hispanica TaxID=1086592 RepID=UPI00217FD0A7|nr:solute carrier family 12 member 8 isoform X2 [Cataglyphis hispanica]
MESNDQSRLSNGDTPVHRDVDWARYGLREPEMQRNEKRNNGDSNNTFDPEMYQAGANELFAQEYSSDPWWKSNFFISQPVLFGTWDGVFTSCLINIFGVIVFLRSGWIVGQAGVLNAVLIIFCTDSGFEGWLSGNLKNNTFPNYQDGYNWFTVFGVFFPTVTGVLAGINMSGDLRHPSSDIPNGTLAALGTGTFLYLCFSLTLAATCARNALLTNFTIASTVSAISVLLLAGLYVSSFSSCLGAMYGTPRVLQSIASQNVIPGMRCLQRGRGPNKVPIYAMLVVAMVTLTFIITGQINTLAPIVTMPFLLTYACLDYAYFALAQTFDLRHTREQRFRTQSPTFDRNYGSASRNNSMTDTDNDLDSLFPERIRHKNLVRNNSISDNNIYVDSSPSIEDSVSVNSASERKVHIHNKLENWYSPLCNRWFSLLGCLVKLLIMFLVHWGYAIVNIVVVFLVWSYVGHANPAVKPGVSAEFQFFKWLRTALLKLVGRKVYDYEQIVVTPMHPGVETCSAQLNEENEDFLGRRRYHQTATVTGQYVNVD